MRTGGDEGRRGFHVLLQLHLHARSLDSLRDGALGLDYILLMSNFSNCSSK